MGLFSGITRFVGNLFGGDDDEEKKKRQRQSQPINNSYRAPQKSPTFSNQNNQNNGGNEQVPLFQQQQQKQPNREVNLYLPGKDGQDVLGQPLKKAQPGQKMEDTERKLKEMTQANMDKAKQEASQGEGWIGRNILNRGAIQKRAEVSARSRAVRTYQEQNDQQPNAVVQHYNRETSDISDRNTRDAQAGVDRLKKAGNAVDKVGRVAQYVPVTGSVLNVGLSGAERLQKATGRKGDVRETADTRDRLDFGMTTEEKNKLDDKTKGKLQTVRNIGLAASPLDLLGFGGLVKSEGVSAAKNAAVQVVKKGAVDEATKTALKTGAKNTAKNLALPTALGTGITLGGQQYLTGDMDPVEAAKNGLMVGGTSLLFPGRSLKKAAAQTIDNSVQAADEVAPGVRSVNPNQAEHAMEQAVDNTPAYQRRAPTTVGQADAQARNGVYNVPEKALDADARMVSGGAPDPLDVPTFMRRGAPTKAASAKEQTAQLEARAATIRNDMGQVGKFNDKQEIAAAFAESPQKGQATARLVKSRNERVDPEAEMAKVVTAQRQAAEELRAAEDAKAAQNAIESADNQSAPVAPAEAPIEAPRVPVETPVETPTPAVVEDPAIVESRQVYEEGAQSDIPVVQQVAQEQLATLDDQPPATPAMPETPAATQVPVAPRTHDALVAELGPSPDRQKGKYNTRDQIDLDELKTRAEGVIANMDDEGVLKSFQTTGPETMITDANSFALARAALSRIAQSDDPAAAQTVTNIMDAMERYASKSGQGLRIVQEEFDTMPLPMKVRYIIKKIDNANAETKNYQPLRDDPAKAEVIEATITGHLKTSQGISERVAQIQGQLNEVADAAMRGEKTDTNTASLIKTLRTEQRNLAANNGELVKYYQDLLPKRSRGQRVNDFARRMMLASFTGRVNDLITTAGNITNLGAQNFTQGLLSKAVNLVKPGTVTDTWRGTKQFFQGTGEGLRKGGSEFTGTQYAPDLEQSLRNNSDMRTGLQKATGPVGRTIQAATELATKASEGVRDQRLYQLAVQEGQQAGLKGNMLRQYAEARAAVPNRHMLEQADMLHREVNNLNENPVSRGLNRVASSIEGKSAIGGFIKNQIVPFTSWLGGNIYNTVTDKNVVASAMKVAVSAAKGDAEGVVRNLAKFANNAAYTYALGYVLTQQGIITNQDAEGYNDAGAYIHVGDRYIPVAFTGFFAPNIVLGNAAYNGLNNSEGGSPAAKIANAASQALLNMGKSVSVTSAVGADNNITRSLDAANRPNGSAGDGLATFGGGAAGQFIPAIGNDINAAINNGLNVGGMTIVPDNLNPTHEKADTKVTETNPETGRERKDYVASAGASLVNRIPFASQQLPRKADIAAPDMFDRLTKGNRDTPGGKQARADEQTKTDQATDFKNRGVPNFREKNFDETVKARIEAGDYDQAIEGLKAKLDDQGKNRDIPKSKNDTIERQIKELTVTRDGGFAPDIIETYKKTSLTEWRNMGDPESEDHNPELYAILYRYDSALAAAGVSRNTTKSEKNFFSAKPEKKSSGGSGSRGRMSTTDRAAADALKIVQSNKVGSTPDLGKVTFGELAPQKAGSIKMPTIQQIKAGDLIKKRTISVSKARG